MKNRFIWVIALLGAMASQPAAEAGGRGGRAGGHHASKPSGGHHASKPSGGHHVSKPSGGAHKPSRPSGGSSVHRPSGGGQHVSRPSGGGSRGGNVRKPASRPEIHRPSGSGGGLPSSGGKFADHRPDIKRPDNRPNIQRPDNRPNLRPDAGNRPNLPNHPSGNVKDFLGLDGDRTPSLPNRRPGGDLRPDSPSDRIANLRPDSDRPKLPTRPGQDGGGERWRPGDNVHPDGGRFPNRPDGGRFPNRPDDGGRFPNRPDNGWNPGRHPGFDPDHRPGHPDRPPRPDRPEKWQNIHDNSVNNWNQWKQNNNVQINNFQVNRTNNWNNINTRYNERGWAGRYGSDDYWKWRDDVFDFRKDRCEEIWDRREDFWDDAFDNHWWGSCWWRPRPYVPVPNVSPWWWWKPFAWASAGAFFGATIAPQPVVYDPGTTVIYEGDTYYVDGKPSGSATEARRSAIQLATPAVQETPVPDPAPEGQAEEWMPLGVWALTQQEQGDATMFMQFSVNKDGLLGGAYKNVMTGDEQPIVGQLDKKTQRIAWHVGDATQTVYETGLSSVENDVASVFVHFGEAQTQTWLLVRLPSPELPPGTVKLPERKK